ncbi:putative PAN domain containing protein [Neospora caninum Liverpool]|uniref:Putative PAN domain containing protein n=1 Tax=Neospora caninum (strain Liverpool) TaxID=572307 RepID=F0V8T4_NEOCL|nr:putative PAN domain containing protein [Neospora caninum Liverpool]CBZ50125.1 putative PAN domain containing protein [Neospora caninum Liverpool]|eukprot:XP_003880160.1 putative PAN domain containing protein [Neospora caninum Liverpool]
MEPSSAEDVPYPIVSNPRRRPRRMIGHGDVAIVFIVLAATLASPSLCDRAINYEDQRSTDGGNRHRSASVEGRRYQEEYAPRMLSGPASESSDPNPTARELAQQLLQELYKRDVVLTNRQILQVLPSLLPQVEALGLDAAEFEDEFRSLLATRVGVSQKTAEQSRGPLSQRKITKVPRRDLNDPARYTENKPRSSTVARQEGNSHKLDEENRFSIRDREYPAFIPTPELRGFGTPTPAPLMKQSEGITNEYTEELPEETDVLAGETAKLGEEEELDGQQLFQLWKKANRRQRTVNKDFDLVVGGDELLRVRATTYKRTGPAPSTGTDVTVVPLVAASFDAPGESALTLVQAFNGEPGELRRMFAEAVIDSIPGRLKYLWNVSESDVRLFSIQDNDISVYLNTTNIVHRPEPMSTPLSFTPGCNFTRSLTDQTQIGTSSTPCVRIQWDLLDSIGRGEIGTTELVEAVNADLMSQTNSHILGRQSEFGRRAGTVLGNVIRVARSAYSISGAPVKDQPTGPNAGQCFKRGVDFYGFDVKKLEAGEIHTAGECAEHCKFVDTCYYWTFNQARRWCYLKNAYAPEGLHSDSTATKDLISGLKNCNVLPDPYPSEPCYLVGVDILTAKTGYTRVITSSSSALQCHAECVMDPYCFYWTYKSYQRFCVLKGRDLVDVTSGQQAANQGETSTTDGLISGAKRCKTNQAIDRHVRRLMEVDDSELSQDLCYQPGIEFNLSRDHVVREETAVYSPEQCDLLCAAELGCVSWTYKFKTKRCFLLASDAHTAKRVVGESPDGPAGEEEAALSGLFGARHCIGASSSQLGEPLQSSESTPATGNGFRMGTGGGFLARDEKNRDKHLQGKNPGAIRQDAVAQNGASPKQVKEQPTSKENAAEPTASPLRHTDTLSSPVSGNDKERNKHMEMAGPDVTTNDAHVTKGNKHDDHGDRGTRAGIGTRDDVRGSQTNTQPPNTIREKVPLHLDAYRTREDETKIGGTTDTNAIGQSAPCEREGVALTGGDFFAIGDPGADTGTAQGIVMQNSQQCAAYCAASVGCTFWTMDKESGLCYLKTAAALSTYKRDDTTKNFVSGSVTAGSDCLL